jgi:hypothetical protein
MFNIITTKPEAKEGGTKTVNCDIDRWDFAAARQEMTGWRKKTIQQIIFDTQLNCAQ